MSSTSKVSNPADKNRLVEEEISIDNSRILHLQRQLIREQDEELEKLAGTISNTTHLAWAINEEFRLLEGLSVDVNKYVEVPDSRLQRAERRLAILNKRSSRGGCSCLGLLSFSAILFLAAVIYVLIKYFRS